jgi:alkylation response protein AidB-like acyl-CoA dehydrogenase
MFRGDLIACQLFSEPGAGSDLAGVETKAVRDGDRWVISGQKVWTSGAHLSDVGEILCRTNPEVPKHQGLTAFVVDMHAPGVVVRPLRQMTGGASFDEVFFDEVIVPDDHRLGDVDGGWSVVITTLLHERSSIGAGALGESDPSLVSGARLLAMLRHLGRDDDPVLRQSLAKVYSGFQVARWTNARALARTVDGVPPGPEMSLAKLAFSRNLTATAEFVADALGPHIAADTGEWGTFAWANFLLSAPGTRIGGGTDEVQRTIVGDRVLGLPKEPR